MTLLLTERMIVAVDPELFVGCHWLRQPMESRAVVGTAEVAVVVGTFVVVVVVIVPVAVETGDRGGSRMMLMMHVLVLVLVASV